MIGPSMNGKGGIASVVRGYFNAGIIHSLNITYYSTHCDGSKKRKFIYYFLNIGNILLQLRKYSIIHIHTASLWSFRRLSVIIFLSKILSKKIIIHVHGAMFDHYYNSSFFIEKFFIRLAFTIADIVFCLSPEWSHKISLFCSPNKINILPNCVPLPPLDQISIRQRKLKYPKTILFLGELSERKGVTDLLKAISLLDLAPNRVRIILGGNGDLAKINNEIVRLRIDNIVSVIGWIDGAQKISLLMDAYLYVLPSYFEGLPMSILEAMSYCTPIISTLTGGIPHAIKDGFEGYLITPGDINALAKTINKLLKDETTWTFLSTCARNKIESEFSSEIMFQKLKLIYIDLLKNKMGGEYFL